MYELIQVSETCYYIQSPAKIGLVRLTGDEVCLIDSGSDKDAAKKAFRHITANGWKLRAVYNTHSHADHIGGNHYLQAQTGCPIYAPGIERAFTEAPVLESCFLYGGFSPRDLRHKFLMAQESTALPLTEEVLPPQLQAIPLPGHTFEMAGFRSEDGIVYLADCLSSKETLEKYRIGFLTDVGAYLSTLETVKTLEAKLFVPAHAEPTEDIAPLAQYNIDTVQEIADTILRLCAERRTFEALLAELFAHYGLTMTIEQHALVGSTVRSYLAWLRDGGKVNIEIADNRLYWHTVG